jgi:hypothetical protein
MDLQEVILQKVNELNIEEMVKEIIKEQLSHDVRREINRQVESKVSKLIEVEFDIQMKQPVKTDDGWGKKETYSSFEELFKTHFRKAMDSTYEVKNQIGRIVKEKTEAMVKEYSTAICKKVAEEIITKCDTKAGAN